MSQRGGEFPEVEGNSTDVQRPSGGSALVESFRRIALATMIAVPATAVLSFIFYFLPPNVSAGIGLFGLILFSIGRAIPRPLLAGLGGVILFAGVLAWALRQ